MDQEIEKTDELEIQQLIENLGDSNTHIRKDAREKLVAKGIIIHDYLIKLLDHPKHIYRWEAIKTMEEIGDPLSIPVFIQSLEDSESDIRWIAAEGLTKLESHSIKPILERIIEKSEHSIFLFTGVHHVFNRFKKKGMFPEDFQMNDLLFELKKHSTTGSIKTHAHRILSKLES